jgi:hypothetical protein
MTRFEFNSDGLICIDDFVKGYLHMHAAQKAIVSNASAIVADLQPEMIEAQANLSKPKLIGAGRFIIHPLGLGSSVWDFCVTFLLLTTVITMPLVIGWDTIAKQMFVFNFMMDMIFGLDIIKNFSTGYVEDSTGNIIMNRKTITVTYVKTWFVIDLVSMLPIGEFN